METVLYLELCVPMSQSGPIAVGNINHPTRRFKGALWLLAEGVAYFPNSIHFWLTIILVQHRFRQR